MDEFGLDAQAKHELAELRGDEDGFALRLPDFRASRVSMPELGKQRDTPIGRGMPMLLHGVVGAKRDSGAEEGAPSPATGLPRKTKSSSFQVQAGRSDGRAARGVHAMVLSGASWSPAPACPGSPSPTADAVSSAAFAAMSAGTTTTISSRYKVTRTGRPAACAVRCARRASAQGLMPKAKRTVANPSPWSILALD